jgi:hypothetical protein
VNRPSRLRHPYLSGHIEAKNSALPERCSKAWSAPAERSGEVIEPRMNTDDTDGKKLY